MDSLFLRISAVVCAALMLSYAIVSAVDGEIIQTVVCLLISIILIILDRIMARCEKIEELLDERNKGEHPAERIRADRRQG